MKKLTPLMFGLMLAFGASSAAVAQGAPSNSGTGAPAAAAQPQAQATEFAEPELQQFADVQPEIETIRAEYSERLQDVSDPDKAAELQNEAVGMMVETVTEAGMEVETYNRIAIALQSDPELRERIQSMMN